MRFLFYIALGLFISAHSVMAGEEPAPAQAVVDGRSEKHARLITFDPRMSMTAGLSDEWIPMVLGTDGLVALAMANVIMQEGLADTSFTKELICAILQSHSRIKEGLYEEAILSVSDPLNNYLNQHCICRSNHLY